MSRLDCMGDLLKILHNRDYIKLYKKVDSIFVLAKYESVFNKIIETANANDIVYRASDVYTKQINPSPFGDIGQYNIALYDVDEVNNIFNSIEGKALAYSIDSYSVAYHYNSGVFRNIRGYDINSFRGEMESCDYELLSKIIDDSKLLISKIDRGALGGFPIIATIVNVEQKRKDMEALSLKTKEADEFVKSL